MQPARDWLEVHGRPPDIGTKGAVAALTAHWEKKAAVARAIEVTEAEAAARMSETEERFEALLSSVQERLVEQERSSDASASKIGFVE